MFNFIAKLPLRGKLALVVIAMLIPLSVLAFMTARTEWDEMSLAQSEDLGLKWSSQLITVAANLSEFTEHAAAIAAGHEEERAEMMEHQGLVRGAVDELDKLSQDSEQALVTASGWAGFKPRVIAALEGPGGSEEHQESNRKLITDIHVAVNLVAEHTGLKLDPGADTFPLMNAAILKLPQGIEAMASARRAMDAIASGDKSTAVHAALGEHAGVSQTLLEDGMHALKESYAQSAAKTSKIPGAANALDDRMDTAIASMKAHAYGKADGDVAKLSNDAEVMTEDLTTLRQDANAELATLLDARAAAAKRDLIIESVIALVFILLAFYVSVQVTRYISMKIKQANDVFGRLAEGKYDSELGPQQTDELGTLISALDKMQGQLRARVEADQRAAAEDRARAVATERIKQALDASSVNVVVADDQCNVIYLNPAAQRLMSSAENDFRQVQPRFNATQIVGSSLASFYQDGARQVESILSQRQSATSQYAVGSRTMQATVSPITDAEGKRIGTVVEWLDRTQEVAAEKEIGSLVAAVSEGKLDQRISLTGKSGFFEVLANGLNGLVSNVGDVVAELRRLVQSANDGDLTHSMDLNGKSGLYVSIGSGVNSLVEKMASVVSQVKSMASQVHTGAEEISKGNTNLSQRTEEQASSLEETASSMEEMTSTVKQTADNAGQANQLAMAARQQAEKGGAVVSTAVTAMGAINDASKKIADIIGVIDEIAFQTNLLALNAAVEAARAGEQGRGFAVVATEVRNLAGRSATAAKEIKALIQDSVAKVDEGSKLVDESGKTLEEIVMAVKKVTDIVAEIAAASREQSSGIEQVNKAVMQMDETTQQNAALVEEAAAASQAIVEQAQTLNALVVHYRVRDNAGAGMAPVAIEKRASQRPWTKSSKAAPAAAESAPAPRKVAAGGGDGEWTEF